MSQNIYSKIFAVQNEIGVLSKDADNPYYKSRYLTLDKIVANLLPLLAKQNLCLLQMPQNDSLVTQVIDMESGDKVEASCRLQCPDDDPQKQGSAITYARRYSLGCLFQIQTEEDDDGNKATFASEAQVKKIWYEIKRTGTDVKNILSYYKVSGVEKMTSKQAHHCIESLCKKADA